MDFPPPDIVLRSFGCAGPAVPLPGGQGTSWRADDVVLKPVAADQDETWQWLDQVPPPALGPSAPRIGLPVRTVHGPLPVRGWGATRWLTGSSQGVPWRRRAEASLAFTRAVTAPHDLPHRTDPWARADRQAWGEEPLPSGVPASVVALFARIPTTDAPPQLVHGDITGNVIDDPHLGLGIIDLSLYLRPAA